MVTMFGSRLRELRRNMKLQQDQVAKLIGVTKNAISNYENNIEAVFSTEKAPCV